MKGIIAKLGRTSLAIITCVVTHSVLAKSDVLSVKENAPKTYEVKKGDTLWDISALYLDSPWLWPRLWQINPDINDPHLIYPGDKLTLVWRNGQPMLSRKPLLTLSPKARILDKDAVPTLPEGLVLPYINSDRLVTKEVLDSAMRVIGTQDGRRFLSQHDQLFIDGKTTEKHWGIYRSVAEYQRSDTGEEVFSLKMVATATLVKSEEKLSSLKVESQNQEILSNDFALPHQHHEELSFSNTFYPEPAPKHVSASILGSLEGSKFIGRNQVVIIDRGLNDKVEQGTMFDLWEEGLGVSGTRGNYIVDDGWLSENLPDVSVGEMIVIRPYASFSIALITRSKAPIHTQTMGLSPLLKEQQNDSLETKDEDS